MINFLDAILIGSKIIAPVDTSDEITKEITKLEPIQVKQIIIDKFTRDSRLNNASTFNFKDFNAIPTNNSQTDKKKKEKDQKDGPPLKNNLKQGFSISGGSGITFYGDDLGKKGIFETSPGLGSSVALNLTQSLNRFVDIRADADFSKREIVTPEYKLQHWSNSILAGLNIKPFGFTSQKINPSFTPYFVLLGGVDEFESILKQNGIQINHVGGHDRGLDGRTIEGKIVSGIGANIKLNKNFSLKGELTTSIFENTDKFDALKKGSKNDGKTDLRLYLTYFPFASESDTNALLKNAELFVKAGIIRPYTDLGNNNFLGGMDKESSNTSHTYGMDFVVPLIKSLKAKFSFANSKFGGQNKIKNLKYDLLMNEFLVGLQFYPLDFSGEHKINPFISTDIGSLNFESTLYEISSGNLVNQVGIKGNGINGKNNQLIANLGLGVVINLGDKFYLMTDASWTAPADFWKQNPNKGNDYLDANRPTSQANKHDDCYLKVNAGVGFKLSNNKITDEQKINQEIKKEKERFLDEIVINENLKTTENNARESLDSLKNLYDNLKLKTDSLENQIKIKESKKEDKFELKNIPDLKIEENPIIKESKKQENFEIPKANDELPYELYVVKPGDNLTTIITGINGFKDQKTLKRQNLESVKLTAKLTKDEELRERIYDIDGHNWEGSVIKPGDTLSIYKEYVGKKKGTSSLEQKIDDKIISNNLSNEENNIYNFYINDSKSAAKAIAQSYNLDFYDTIEKIREKGLIVNADIRIIKNSNEKMNILYDTTEIYLNSRNLKEAKNEIKEKLNLNIKSDSTILKYVDYYASLIGTQKIRKSEFKKSMKDFSTFS